MNTRLFQAGLVFLLTLCAGWTHAEVYVVSHPESGIEFLNVEQLAAMALGQTRMEVHGKRVQLVEQSETRRVFHEFHNEVTGMSNRQLASYWAKRIFTGRGRAPRRLGDDAQVMLTVSKHPELIGYVTSPPAGVYQSLRVVYRFEGIPR